MSNSFSVVTYSPADVYLTIGGYRLTGWDTITITRSTKAFKTIKGIRGKNTRDRVLDTSATIAINMIQTSPSNDVLSTIHNMDIQNGTGRIELTLSDKSGKSTFSSTEGYITGFPVAAFSGDFSYRVWEIFLQSTTVYNVAGNTRPETSLFDSLLSNVSDFVSGL